MTRTQVLNGARHGFLRSLIWVLHSCSDYLLSASLLTTAVEKEVDRALVNVGETLREY